MASAKTALSPASSPNGPRLGGARRREIKIEYRPAFHPSGCYRCRDGIGCAGSKMLLSLPKIPSEGFYAASRRS